MCVVHGCLYFLASRALLISDAERVVAFNPKQSSTCGALFALPDHYVARHPVVSVTGVSREESANAPEMRPDHPGILRVARDSGSIRVSSPCGSFAHSSAG